MLRDQVRKGFFNFAMLLGLVLATICSVAHATNFSRVGFITAEYETKRDEIKHVIFDFGSEQALAEILIASKRTLFHLGTRKGVCGRAGTA